MDKQKAVLEGDRAALVRSVFSDDSVSEQSRNEPNGQIESLVEDFELLKGEIKQTLIDLREVVMKDRTIFKGSANHPAVSEDLLAVMPELESKVDLTPGYLAMDAPESTEEKDTPKDLSTLRDMGQIFQWILGIRQAGLSSVVLAEFLESYARSIGESSQAGQLAMFVVKIVQQMKTDDLAQESPSSLETYGLYIGELGNLLMRDRGSNPPTAEAKSTESCSDDSIRSSHCTSRKMKSLEVDDGQSDSHSLADDSFDHRCCHCNERHDSGHK